jgi:uncharacterized delta-60 repeat protein
MALASLSSLRAWLSGASGRSRSGRCSGRRLRLEPLEERTLLNAGDLDPTFGNGGLVTSSFPGLYGSIASSLAVQSDGHIVAGGTVYNYSGRPGSSFAVARYANDGSLDSSFGTDGVAFTSFATHGYLVASGNSVAAQADGRIIVAGTITGTGKSSSALALTRYTSDGNLDTSFGSGGEVLTSFQYSTGASSVAVQPDGHIVVAGGTGNPGSPGQIAVARYDSNGSLDRSFGTGGKVTTSFPDGNAGANILALLPDGRIVVAGTATSVSSSSFLLARYASDGRLDTSFGTDGLVTTAFPGASRAGAYSLVAQGDGSIVAAGDAYDGNHDRVALARYDTDGSLDASFGTDGLVTTSFGGTSDSATGVVLQLNGRIVVACHTNAGAVPFALARYDTDGSLDGSFGSGGLVTTSFPGFNAARASAVTVQPDGRIVAAGSVYPSAGLAQFALARYEGDALEATHFAVTAPATVTAGQPFDVTVTAVDDNGNVVPDYTGTVTLSSSDPRTPVLGSHTFTTADAGVFTFTAVRLVTAGPQSLFADDGDLSGQADLTVDPGLAVALVLSGPDQVSAGVSFVVTLTAYDAYGNVATGYRGSVSFVSTDPAAQLPVGYTFTSDDAGSHDFTITLNSPGPVRLTAIDTYALTLSYLDLTVS